MALAVCVLFDERGDRLVRELWARLEDRGIRTLASHTHGRHHPHLSYAVLLDSEPAPVLTALAALPDAGVFEVSVHGSLVFPRGRVALAVSVPAGVHVRHDRVVAALGPVPGLLHHHYEPAEWVPHVSVATGAPAARLPEVVTAVADVLPMRLGVRGAALVDSTTGRRWDLPTVP